MKLSERTKEIFVLVLSLLVFIYAIVDIFHQIQLDIFPRITSWAVLIYSFVIMFAIIKDWNIDEE